MTGTRYVLASSMRLIGIDTPETQKPGVAMECGGPEGEANMLRQSPTPPEDSDCIPRRKRGYMAALAVRLSSTVS
jgi:hypothetical protein